MISARKKDLIQRMQQHPRQMKRPLLSATQGSKPITVLSNLHWHYF